MVGPTSRRALQVPHDIGVDRVHRSVTRGPVMQPILGFAIQARRAQASTFGQTYGGPAVEPRTPMGRAQQSQDIAPEVPALMEAVMTMGGFASYGQLPSSHAWDEDFIREFVNMHSMTVVQTAACTLGRGLTQKMGLCTQRRPAG